MYEYRQRESHRGRTGFWIIIALIILMAAGYVVYALKRPLSTIQPTLSLKPAVASQPVNIAWPKFGEAAIGASGMGVLKTHGELTRRPTASTAKMMTAMAVLKARPLKLGEQGPVLTLTQQDVEFYNNYYAKDGSLVLVKAGEKITEYQALEAMLLPSANNMAETLAIWAYGSVNNYAKVANQLALSYGMTNTQIVDASGFSPATVSTASDLVKLGLQVIQNPVLKQIVSQKTAVVPVAGIVHNVNFLLGTDGINGIKTGDTDQAGGVYLFSVPYQVDATHSVTIVGAVMGGKTVYDALNAGPPIINSVKPGFHVQKLFAKGQAVGSYNAPWGSRAEAVANNSLTVLTWGSQASNLKVNLNPLTAPAAAGQTVGEAKLTGGQTAPVKINLASSMSSPSWQWRLKHPQE